MRDVLSRDALLTALNADSTDTVSLTALADWFEENDQPEAALVLHWAVRNNRRPGHYERQSMFGKYFWSRQHEQPFHADSLAQLPAVLWDTLQAYDEPYSVSMFKSYQDPRAAILALAVAGKALTEALPDLV